MIARRAIGVFMVASLSAGLVSCAGSGSEPASEQPPRLAYLLGQRVIVVDGTREARPVGPSGSWRWVRWIGDVTVMGSDDEVVSVSRRGKVLDEQACAFCKPLEGFPDGIAAASFDADERAKVITGTREGKLTVRFSGRAEAPGDPETATPGFDPSVGFLGVVGGKLLVARTYPGDPLPDVLALADMETMRYTKLIDVPGIDAPADYAVGGIGPSAAVRADGEQFAIISGWNHTSATHEEVLIGDAAGRLRKTSATFAGPVDINSLEYSGTRLFAVVYRPSWAESLWRISTDGPAEYLGEVVPDTYDLEGTSVEPEAVVRSEGDTSTRLLGSSTRSLAVEQPVLGFRPTPGEPPVVHVRRSLDPPVARTRGALLRATSACDANSLAELAGRGFGWGFGSGGAEPEDWSDADATTDLCRRIHRVLLGPPQPLGTDAAHPVAISWNAGDAAGLEVVVDRDGRWRQLKDPGQTTAPIDLTPPE